MNNFIDEKKIYIENINIKDLDEYDKFVQKADYILL
jgi:hypothetical protein